MPSDISCPADWTEFDNVYQFHCPECTLENSTRDVSHISPLRLGTESMLMNGNVDPHAILLLLSLSKGFRISHGNEVSSRFALMI